MEIYRHDKRMMDGTKSSYTGDRLDLDVRRLLKTDKDGKRKGKPIKNWIVWS